MTSNTLTMNSVLKAMSVRTPRVLKKSFMSIHSEEKKMLCCVVRLCDVLCCDVACRVVMCGVDLDQKGHKHQNDSDDVAPVLDQPIDKFAPLDCLQRVPQVLQPEILPSHS